MALIEMSGAVDGGVAPPPRLSLGKRLVDVVVGTIVCVVAIPVMLVLALVLAAQHRTNPFFVHERIGRGGRIVRIPKLRTLSPDTPRYADKTITPIEAADRLSRFLRSRHLDELPQLLLVPPGRLSLVGPRPRMVAEAELHDDDEYEVIRTSVPQGCTGLWQVSGETGRVSDHPEYDRFYVEQHTVRLDAWILWRTLRQALFGGAVGLADVPSWALRAPELAIADTA